MPTRNFQNVMELAWSISFIDSFPVPSVTTQLRALRRSSPHPNIYELASPVPPQFVFVTNGWGLQISCNLRVGGDISACQLHKFRKRVNYLTVRYVGSCELITPFFIFTTTLSLNGRRQTLAFQVPRFIDKLLNYSDATFQLEVWGGFCFKTRTRDEFPNQQIQSLYWLLLLGTDVRRKCWAMSALSERSFAKNYNEQLTFQFNYDEVLCCSPNFHSFLNVNIYIYTHFVISVTKFYFFWH